MLLKENTASDRRVVDENTALRAILEGTARATGERFFDELVISLSKALNTHGAWVTEYLAERHQLRALAFWMGGRMVRDHIMEIAGTPCEAVIRTTTMVHCPEKVIDQFPAASALEGFGAVSYLGAPLLDQSGRIIGNLAVLDTRPMPDDSRVKAIFRIFAARASAELQRLKTEQELRRFDRLANLTPRTSLPLYQFPPLKVLKNRPKTRPRGARPQ